MPVPHGPDSINLDYRLTALLLAMASRKDLLQTYLNQDQQKKGKKLSDRDRWETLLKLGFPIEMLQENLYVFQNDVVQKALATVQKAMQTMVNLNDYCPDVCPSNNALGSIVGFTAGVTQPLGKPGARS